METNEFIEILNSGKRVEAGSETHKCMHRLSVEARRVMCELNGSFHDEAEIVELFSKLTGKKSTTRSGFSRLFIPIAAKI